MESKKLPIKLPRHALSNIEIKKFAHLLQIPHFRGVYMRNKLPKNIYKNESGVINIDDKNGSGTHWTAYIKNNKHIVYFDSIGNLRPPLEVVKYFKSDNSGNKILYNYDKYQNVGSFNCGQLCLKFLYTHGQRKST